MRLLLDTQVFLWIQTHPDRLEHVDHVLRSSQNDLFLSAASSWELAIKFGLGKLDLPEQPDVYVPSRMQSSGVDGLAVQHSHGLRVASLPRHHRDPFDRLLVAQAQLEELTLVTADPIFDLYNVDLVRTDGPRS